MEFWFSIIKVAAIISMIAFGGYLLFSGSGGPDASVANLWQDGGFFPNGISGLVMAMAVIMFSFGGLELVGITAAEADDPQKSIPKATNQVIYRILLFYVGSLAVLLSLYPWKNVVEGGSPFVLIFMRWTAISSRTPSIWWCSPPRCRSITAVFTAIAACCLAWRSRVTRRVRCSR
jgi:aromatic amino acid transport protein AroP